MAKRPLLTPVPARPRRLLNIRDAAGYLGISEQTLRNWLSMKRLGYVKVGSRTMLALEDLDAFIEKHKVRAASSE